MLPHAGDTEEQPMNKLGYEEGDTCGRDGCDGVIAERPPVNCYCHLSAPCGECTSDRIYCPECSWTSVDDPLVRQDIAAIHVGVLPYIETKRRVLDPTKIDFVCEPHSSSSMIKEGVYPEGATREEVEKAVRGTFGGGFAYFRDGRFKYIAYTD